jgi:hypothetical protein
MILPTWARVLHISAFVALSMRQEFKLKSFLSNKGGRPGAELGNCGRAGAGHGSRARVAVTGASSGVVSETGGLRGGQYAAGAAGELSPRQDGVTAGEDPRDWGRAHWS